MTWRIDAEKGTKLRLVERASSFACAHAAVEILQTPATPLVPLELVRAAPPMALSIMGFARSSCACDATVSQWVTPSPCLQHSLLIFGFKIEAKTWTPGISLLQVLRKAGLIESPEGPESSFLILNFCGAAKAKRSKRGPTKSSNVN